MTEAAMRSHATGHDLSIADLLRMAAERSLAVSHVPASSDIDTPSMRGKVLTEEVQPGLLLSGFDLTYIADARMPVELDRSITCAILLAGDSEPLEVGDHASFLQMRERVQIVGFGEKQICVRPWRAGQSARVASVTLKPCFFDRFGDQVDDTGLAGLRRFCDAGIQAENLPWSARIVDLANAALDEPYGGTLLTLYRESQALRFTLEIAALLREEARLVSEMGRRPYDRARQAREMLDRDLVNPPKMLELARSVGVNVTTLQASFKTAFGTTLFGYVKSRRLDIARILLREGSLGAAEAGYKVGFTNASAFSAAYRRQFGRSPAQEQHSSEIGKGACPVMVTKARGGEVAGWTNPHR